MRKSFVSYLPLNTNLAALLLRLIFGGLMIYHGCQKIDLYDKILPMFKDIIGIGPKLSFNLVIFAEFFCGLMVTIGLFTRVFIIPIIISMGVAFFIAHQKDNFMIKELPFLFFLLTFVVFVLGSGKYSVDGLLFKRSAATNY
jgi:putative oxidoreductase